MMMMMMTTGLDYLTPVNSARGIMERSKCSIFKHSINKIDRLQMLAENVFVSLVTCDLKV